MTRRALITGVAGQDGSYLAEHLVELGYEVHGTVRFRGDRHFGRRIEDLVRDRSLTVHVSDVTDGGSTIRLLERVRPDEVYNLAAQSSVGASFDQPVNTGEVTALGAVKVLEAIRSTDPSIRFYQASSSEMFGSAPPPQDERTPFHPRSPYAIAKLYAHWATVNYREAHGVHASAGILFNHESPRRGLNFVTRKITRGVAEIARDRRRRISLGNLDIRRDWGHARDYVRAMHSILELDEPVDLVIGTGISHTLREWLEVAFSHCDLNWKDHVEIDPDLYRPSDVEHVEADPSLAAAVIGWAPTVTFEALVIEMVEDDLDSIDLS